MGYNKFITKNNETLLDLTGDTVTPDVLLKGYTAHNASGEPIVGKAESGGTEWDGSYAILMSFTIGDTTYQAEDGMTWGEWVASDYNTGGVIVNENGYVYTSGGGQVYKNNYDNGVTDVYSTVAIIEGATYRVFES